MTLTERLARYTATTVTRQAKTSLPRLNRVDRSWSWRLAEQYQVGSNPLWRIGAR